MKLVKKAAAAVKGVYVDDTPLLPIMTVSGNSVLITSGDATPDAADHTDFGDTPLLTTVTRVFTIANIGTADLEDLSVIAPAGYTVTVQPAATVAAGDSTTFSVRFNSASHATLAGDIEISSNLPVYTFAITATAVAPVANVKGNSVTIVNGDVTPSALDHTDFGITPILTTVTRIFIIENTGDANLTDLVVTAPAGYTVTIQPSSPVLPAGSTTFSVRFDATTIDPYAGNVSIASNTEEYTFAIAADVTSYLNTVLTETPLAFYDVVLSNKWQDNLRTVPVAANNDPTGAWDDRSVNNYHATQPTAGSKPPYKTNMISGLPAIDPDGSADNLVLPVTSAASSYTIYAVLDLVAADLNSANHYLFDTAPGARLILGFFSGAANKLAWFDGTTHAPGAAESAGKKLVVWKLQSGGNGTIYRNGVNLGSDPYTAIAISPTNTRIFSQRLGTSEFFNSPLAALIIFPVVHNDSTRERIQAALNDTYGVY